MALLRNVGRVFLFSALLFGVCSEGNAAPSQTRRQLEEVERKRAERLQERQEAEAKRVQLLSQEKNLLGVLDRLDRQIERTRSNIVRLNTEITALNESIAALEAEIAALTEKVNARRGLVSDRLRAIYKINYSTPNGFFALALRADNLSDLLARLEYAARIRLKDNEVIEGYLADQALLKTRKAQLEEQQARRLLQQAELKTEETNLQHEREERRSTLVAIRRNRSLQERAVREIEASIRQLNALIRQLEARARAEEVGRRGEEEDSTITQSPYSTELGSTQEIALALKTFGRVGWPVEGKIVSNASNALEGITIRAEEGTPVRAILDGTVEYAEWFNGLGFGKLLVLNHRNGYRSFYAHLQDFQVREGQRVRKEQTIGAVGSTGSLIGSVLYFEMRRHFHVIDFQRVAR